MLYERKKNMTPKLFVLSVTSGMCFMAIIIIGVYAFKLVLDEFKKPINYKARQERMAYLEAKRQRWEDYFLERKVR